MRGGLLASNPVSGTSIRISDAIDADMVLPQNALSTYKKALVPEVNGQMEISGVPPGLYFVSLYRGNRLLGTDKLVVVQR